MRLTGAVLSAAGEGADRATVARSLGRRQEAGAGRCVGTFSEIRITPVLAIALQIRARPGPLPDVRRRDSSGGDPASSRASEDREKTNAPGISIASCLNEGSERCMVLARPRLKRQVGMRSLRSTFCALQAGLGLTLIAAFSMISGCVSVGTTSAEPPAPRMKSASHSAARATSGLRSGSALTLGIASSSESSSNQGSLTAREST